jgi:Mlc titration factor MtfA (ptsG expression regulator)
MVFRWIKNRRRRKLLAEPPPSEWLGLVEQNVWQYRALPDEDQRRLFEMARIFVAEKNWEGVRGQQIDDQVKLTIAAQACLLTLRRPDLDFDHVISVLVYPSGFVTPKHTYLSDGLALVGDEPVEGVAWHRGPVILSWDEVRAAGLRETDGQNLTLHEFAHQFDMLTGAADGVPPMRNRQELRRWRQVTEAGMRRLESDCRRGRPGVLDSYGLESPAEFFAVATEAFFELPEELRMEQPPLYELLRDFYAQDPTAWSEEA